MENTILTLKQINKCVNENKDILTKYLQEINENIDDPEEFNNVLENLDKNIKFDKNTLKIF